jgi:hypothetical protein
MRLPSTKTADWEKYEAIQADIFSHLLAAVPQLGLRVFQEPSGMDLQGLLEREGAAGSAARVSGKRPARAPRDGRLGRGLVVKLFGDDKPLFSESRWHGSKRGRCRRRSRHEATCRRTTGARPGRCT